MKIDGASRFMLVVLSVPLGGVLGVFVGVRLVDLHFKSQGRGNSHGEILDVLGYDALAVLFCMILLPVSTWLVVRRFKEPIQPPQTTTGSSAPDRV